MRTAPLRLLVGTACALLAACPDHHSSAPIQTAQPPSLVTAPTLVQNPNPAVPLAAVLSLTTDVPTRVELEITEGTRKWTEIAERDFKTVHERVPVLGLRPGREHMVSVIVR